MSEEGDLLEAIVANPDADEPRLVYADWLAAKGDARGELIALQVRLAAEPDDDAHRKQRVLENKLLKEHGEKWTKPVHAILPETTKVIPNEVILRRGFVDEVRARADAAVLIGKIFDRAPVLSRLAILEMTGARRETLSGKLDEPRLARLRSLEVQLPGGGDDLARSIATSKHLAGLVELKVAGSLPGFVGRNPKNRDQFLGDEGAKLLATSPFLKKVRRLELAGNRIEAAGVAAILGGAWPLEELTIRNNNNKPVKNFGKAFADAKRAPTLRRLDLTDTKLSPTDVEQLAKARCLANLEVLELELAHIGPKGIAVLMKNLPPKVTELRVERNALADAGAIELAKAAKAKQLRVLALGHNRMGQKGGEALAASPHLAGLERLYLSEPRWTEETVNAFATSKSLARTRVFVRGKLIKR